MSRLAANRLLPLLAGLAVLLTLTVAMRSCTSGSREEPVLETVPQAPAPDADTPADTINTLMANVSAMNSELTALRQDNAELQQQNSSLVEDRQQIEDNLFTRLQGLLDSSRTEDISAETHSAIAALTSRVDSLAARLEGGSGGMTAVGPADPALPVGLGLESAVSDSASSVWPSPAGTGPDANPLVWILPLEGAAVAGTGQDTQADSLSGRFGGLTDSSLEPVRPPAESLAEAGSALLNPELSVYTVPRNATLIGTTAMTALIGRVPVQGQVQDPMPFKLITGKDNLAANGLRIPGIEGMIWSGTAIGDWTLSCVTGQLESVTFVFGDGTIQTLSSDDGQLGGSGGNGDGTLGWISDDRGIPCISGERKSNASAFLAQSLGFAALEAAGEAAAQAQTATLISNGGAASLVSGDSGKFILGRTLSGGGGEIAAWLRERQSQSFDAVFVPAGAELAIHVDRELAIDFQTNGRRLHHERTHERLPWHDSPRDTDPDLD